MAYMDQDKKAKLAPKIKAILKKYRVKGSLSVRNHSTLVLTIKSSPMDFVESLIASEANRHKSADQLFHLRQRTHLDVNPYWYKDHFTGRELKFLEELMPVMNAGNHDRSDIQTDYFDVGWYVDVSIGKWNQPYIKTA